MLNKTKIVFAAVLLLGTASMALAGDQTDLRGGFVLPGNTVGVNPVFHPRWFPKYARSASSDNGSNAYGFAPAATQTPRTPRERTQNR